jgi:hypothetical protein
MRTLEADVVADSKRQLGAILEDADVEPGSEAQHQIFVRVVGFLNLEGGRFRLGRLVANDIGFDHTGDRAATVHEACRNTISVLLAQISPDGRGEAIDPELLSLWTTEVRPIPRDQSVSDLPPGTVVIAILNERQYPEEILKEMLSRTKNLLI